MKRLLGFIIKGLALFMSALWCRAQAQTNQPSQFLTLREAIQTALRSNRQLQIEQINTEVTRLSLRIPDLPNDTRDSWYYDPVFTTEARKRNLAESGAFDPLNPGLETGFTSESEGVQTTLAGLLPTGLEYVIDARYVYSSGNRNFLNFDTYRLDGNIELRQPLLRDFWIDEPRYVIKVKKGLVRIAEAQLRFVAMDLANQVQQAYYELMFAWEHIRAQDNLVTSRRDLLSDIERKVEIGTMTAQDQRVAASQHRIAQTSLVGASNALAVASNNLKTLMGLTGTNWTQQLYVPTDRLSVMHERFDLITSWQRGLARRPDLRAREFELANAQTEVKFRRNQLFPWLDVVGSYGRKGASSVQTFPPDRPRARLSEAWNQIDDNVAPNDSIGIVLSLPLLRSAERARYRASQQLMELAELTQKQQEELVLREVSDAIHTAQFSYDGVLAAQEATKFAEAAYQGELELLQGGKSSVNFVLQRQADLTQAYFIELAAKRDYNRALSQLQFAEGTVLDQYNFAFDSQK